MRERPDRCTSPAMNPDRMTVEARRALMARIRSASTGPELTVRRLVHRLGYRYVPNHPALPGSPDLAFVGRRKALFVHGCFWHSHECGRGFRPTRNREFWEAKLRRNVERDAEVLARLDALGWRSMTIYECELKGEAGDALAWKLIAFLEG